MPFNLKETGESYADWLARNRMQEASAKESLPENKKLKEEWKMEAKIEQLLDGKAKHYIVADKKTSHRKIVIEYDHSSNLQ